MKQKVTSFLLLALMCLMGVDAYALEKNGEGVYQIGTAQDLLDFAELVNTDPTCSALLTADIDMKDKGWISPSSFAGTFDGGNHTISNLGASFFYSTEGNTVIRNLTLAADEPLVYKGADNGFGVFVCQSNKVNAPGSLLVENCVNNTAVDNQSGKSWTGGIVGGAANGSAEVTTTIRNCVNNASIYSANEAVSGMIGSARKGIFIFENCVNTGDITTVNAAGGILGQGQTATSLALTGCYNTGAITSVKEKSATRTGGIIGNVSGNMTVTMDRCYNLGEISASIDQAGGLIGHSQNSSSKLTITNCFNMGNVSVPTSGGSLLGSASAGTKKIINCWNSGSASGDLFAPTSATCTNCYDVFSEGVGITKITIEQLASGAVAYALNGDQSTIAWYQTLGDDAYPVLDDTHKQVFQATNMYCDGSPKGLAVYNNVGGGQKDDHVFVDGFCSYCHAIDIAYMEMTDSVFLIGTDKQLVWFSAYVNNVDNYANGALTADIDMSTVENFTPIGAFGDTAPKKINYYGTFDGQGHIVSNLMVVTDEKYEAGLFGRVRTATVKNLGVVNATISSNNEQGRIGAIAGFNYESEFINCFAAGDIYLDCTDSEVTEPQKGAIAGGLYGTGVLTNCWSTYEGLLAKSGTTFNNCQYYSKNNKIGEDAMSGALCYALNGNTFLDATWFQTVGIDQFPVLDPTHGIVYMRGEEYNTVMSDEATFATFRADIINNEKNYCDEAVACQDTINFYYAEVESWADIATFDEFCEAYRAGLATKAKVQASENMYKSYIALCTTYAEELAASATHNAHRTFFENYLNEMNTQAPGEYPNGSYAYILDTHLLSNAQMEEEMAYVTSLMNRMLVYNPAPGTEMTVLVENPNFTNDWNGWEREGEGGFAIGGTKSVMTIARGLNYPFEVKQTITEIPNGIYELRMNAMSRASNDISSDYYSGMLFMNDNINYVMSPSEGMVPEDEAVDSVNCLLTGSSADIYFMDEITEVAGYLPNYMVGCSFAYNAGRYLNRVVVEVTDSTLTFGVRDKGAVGGSWLPFANTHLYYLGSADEANDMLTPVLEGYVARANTICNFVSDYGSDYAKRPNISQALKNALSETIQACETATTGAEKMTLVKQFSDLFEQVYDCRQAYIELLKAADFLVDLASGLSEGGVITQEEMEDLMIMISDVSADYTDGTLTADEARAKAKSLYEHPYVPARDENGVYQISTVTQLMSFAAVANKATGSLDAVLLNDIEMPGEGWANVNFTGTFDGQGHTISNLGAPLFYTTEGNSVIKNLTLSADEPLVYSGTEVGYGAFVCQNNKAGAGSLLIENCVNNTDVDNRSGKNWTGGFIGGAANGSAETTTTLRNCVNNATIKSANEAIAGMIGNARKGDFYFENCVNNGELIGPKCIGALVGQGQTPHSMHAADCRNSANITATENSTSRTGGMIGSVYTCVTTTIERCLNEGNISGEYASVGGIVGYMDAKSDSLAITDCYNVGNVSGGSGAAGILTLDASGSKSMTIANCWNGGAVTGGNASTPFARSSAICTNCFDVNGAQVGVMVVTNEQLASGEVTYALNGDQSNIVWYQTLGDGGDAYPLLDSTHKVVAKADNGTYYNTADGVESVQSSESTVHGEIYDLSGRRVEKPARGLYIIGGKKVLMK